MTIYGRNSRGIHSPGSFRYKAESVLEIDSTSNFRKVPGAPEITSTVQAVSRGTWNQACGESFVLLKRRLDIDAREYTGKSENVYDNVRSGYCDPEDQTARAEMMPLQRAC